MFFIENNFLILIASYLFYYANYIALYLIMYVFFYKNNFLKIMHGLWAKYNHEIAEKKNGFEKKKILLAETTQKLHDKTKKYNLFIQQTNIVAKKYFESVAKSSSIDSDFIYTTYYNNIENKIKITEQKKLEIEYTEKLLASYVEEYDDFEFIEKLTIIRSSNE